MKRLFVIPLILSLLFALSTQGICREKIFSTEVVRENPVNLGEYITEQVDFLAELFTRFMQTAKPNANFQDKVYSGLQITIWESKPESVWKRSEWAVVVGKVVKYEEKELFDQPTFYGVEFRGIPLLKDVAEIFEKADAQLLTSEGTVYFGLSYEFRKEAE